MVIIGPVDVWSLNGRWSLEIATVLLMSVIASKHQHLEHDSRCRMASRSCVCLGEVGLPEVFLVADAIQDGFHFGPGTYFTDGSKLYPDPRRREVGWVFLFCHS